MSLLDALLVLAVSRPRGEAAWDAAADLVLGVLRAWAPGTAQRRGIKGWDDDLVQDVICRLVTRTHNESSIRANPEAYLRTAMKFAAEDLRRKADRGIPRHVLPVDDEAGSVADVGSARKTDEVRPVGRIAFERAKQAYDLHLAGCRADRRERDLQMGTLHVEVLSGRRTFDAWYTEDRDPPVLRNTLEKTVSKFRLAFRQYLLSQMERASTGAPSDVLFEDAELTLLVLEELRGNEGYRVPEELASNAPEPSDGGNRK